MTDRKARVKARSRSFALLRMTILNVLLKA